jgi:hypothetical protein
MTGSPVDECPMRYDLSSPRPSVRLLVLFLTLAASVVGGGCLGGVSATEAVAAVAAEARASAVPAAPPVAAHHAGSHHVRVAWRAAATRGATVTGYRVTRIGKDLAGTRRATRVVGPVRRAVRFGSLRNGTTYTFTVAALSRAGRGDVARVRLASTAGSTATTSSTAVPTALAEAAPPGVPTIMSSASGDGRMSITWAPPADTGSSPVTGYRVARDGTDVEGKGPWSTVVPATARTFEMTLLRNGSTYTFSVAAVSGAGQGPAASVRLTPTAASARPGAPRITATSVGDQRATVTWGAPTQTGSSPITGYRVARDGTDVEGKGPWSTVVPATTRSFEMTLLRNGTTYTLSVAAINASGTGTTTTATVTPTAPTPPATTLGDRPVVVQSAIGQPATLRRGGAGGERLRLAGVSVWGVPDTVTAGGGFALGQYEHRAEIAAAVRAWGANHIRLRVLADDYDHDRQGLTKAQRLAMIGGWRDAAEAAGLYLYVTWWDSLDGYAQDAGWPTRYQSAFAMMTDVYHALGDDEHVFYEPFNEPNSFGDQWNAWGTAMRTTVAHWRSLGYHGILVIDTPVWSHAYDDQAMTALEQYDAAQPGMAGRPQLVFAKHDYANEGWPDGGNTFDPAKWRTDTGGAQRDHVMLESEFGNYNGGAATVHPSWSQQAATFFADELADSTRPNYAGATAFLWGPWWDGNALTDGTNTAPTTWGTSVRDGFLRRAAPTRW